MTAKERALAINDADWTDECDLRALIEEHITAAVLEERERVLAAVGRATWGLYDVMDDEDEKRFLDRCREQLEASASPLPSSESGGGPEVR